MQLRDEDRMLILGCVDSLGIALSAHDHEWTEGERVIYEEACRILGGMPRGTFFESAEGEAE